MVDQLSVRCDRSGRQPNESSSTLELKEAARNVILLVSQFSTSSSRNGNSHPLARNACKAQTNIRVANLERQPHHQSGSQLVIRNVPISSVSLRHSLHEERKGLPEALGPRRCPFVMTQTHHNQVM